MQLARLTDAVMVGVYPYPEITELCIARINHAVAVGIVCSQSLKAICRRLRADPVGIWPIVSKELAIVVNDSVAVEVNAEQPCATGDPTGSVFHALGSDVPINWIGRHRR